MRPEPQVRHILAIPVCEAATGRLGEMTMRSSHVFVGPALAIGALAAGACGGDDPATNDTGARPTEPATCPSYAEVRVEPTPPLPGDACADPPSAQSSVAEIGIRQGQDQADADAARLLDPDGFTVVTCGTGAPVPSDRAQSCLAVFVGGQFLLFDAGDGAQRAMEGQGLPVADLSAVFLTHFHSDHVADLGEVISRSWILGRTTPLDVYGAGDVQRIVDGFNLVYTPDEQYRQAHHGEDLLPPDLLAATAQPIEDTGVQGTVVYDQGGVVVTAYTVDHAPVPGLGYRVAFGGRTLGISGDTVDTEGLAALADGVDVLVSEAMEKDFVLDIACALERTGDDRNARLFRDIRTYHVDVRELSVVAAAAGVGTVVLTHLVPILLDAQVESTFVPLMEDSFSGEVVIAEDGLELSID